MPQSQGTVLAAIAMACGSWLGLFFLVRTVLPHAGARWIFFVLFYMAIASTLIPLLKLLNRRLRGRRPAPPDWVSVRQSLWIALYLTTCAWLQIPRVLSPEIAVLLALTFIVLEGFLRLRERGQMGY